MSNLLSKQSSVVVTAATNPVTTKRIEETEPDSDIDPNLIFDPVKRQLHILRQRMKKAQKPGKSYASLKPLAKADGPNGEPELHLRKMVDLT